MEFMGVFMINAVRTHARLERRGADASRENREERIVQVSAHRETVWEGTSYGKCGDYFRRTSFPATLRGSRMTRPQPF